MRKNRPTALPPVLTQISVEYENSNKLAVLLVPFLYLLCQPFEIGSVEKCRFQAHILVLFGFFLALFIVPFYSPPFCWNLPCFCTIFVDVTGKFAS